MYMDGAHCVHKHSKRSGAYKLLLVRKGRAAKHGQKLGPVNAFGLIACLGKSQPLDTNLHYVQELHEAGADWRVDWRKISSLRKIRHKSKPA